MCEEFVDVNQHFFKLKKYVCILLQRTVKLCYVSAKLTVLCTFIFLYTLPIPF